jgi:hypothetical protein
VYVYLTTLSRSFVMTKISEIFRGFFLRHKKIRKQKENDIIYELFLLPVLFTEMSH